MNLSDVIVAEADDQEGVTYVYPRDEQNIFLHVITGQTRFQLELDSSKDIEGQLSQYMIIED